MGPEDPENKCQVVFDHKSGAPFCVDLMCPPIELYNCDPACQCGRPNEFGDGECEPAANPTQCADVHCSA